MNRRSFLASALGLTAAPVAGLCAGTRTAIRLQVSPLAGFQFHAGEALWPRLAVGQPLQLVREPGNEYDEKAVRVDWNGHKLGYVARLDNTAVAQLLDHGKRVRARINRLASSDNPWDRIQVRIELERA